MFIVALLIGLYAYIILLLGLLGLLSFLPLLIVNLVFLLSSIVLIAKYRKKIVINFAKWSVWEKIMGWALVLFFLLHLIGALTPEIYFDALWYHLTLPKIYLQDHFVHFIPGNLFYYSAMPQLVEMLYLPALFFQDEILAKLIHYLFAILCTLVIVKIGSKFWSHRVGLLAGLIFISDLSVAWLSSTAYIDLGRSFFEAVSLYYFLFWLKERKNESLLQSGLIMGFAIATKYFALATLLLNGIFIIFLAQKHRLKKTLLFILPAILTSIFWFTYAYIHTGNPIYPIFTSNLDNSHQTLLGGPFDLLSEFYKLSNSPHDWLSPISPVYLMFIPLIIYMAWQKKKNSALSIYAFLTILIWYLIPRTGGSRFIVPYLPLFALLVSSSIFSLSLKWLKVLAISIIVMILSFNFLLRSFVNKKTIPLLLGKQNKLDYLMQNLDFSNAFYDIDNIIYSLVNSKKPVLIIGGHNLYYFPKNFIHESYYKGEDIDFILTQYQQLPLQYQNDFELIYQNDKISSKLYQKKYAN